MNATRMLLATDWLWPFVGLAMALVAAFTASLVWALGPPRGAAPGSAAPRGGAVWAVTLAAPLLAMALYAALGHPRAINPAARAQAPAESAETLVDKLAERLRTQQPDNLPGWAMLGRTYKVLGRHAEADAAFAHAEALALQDADLLADWVEARVNAQDQGFDTRSRQLLARAMALAPEHPGVLMLRALAALDDGNAAAATRLLTQLRASYAEDSPDHQVLGWALAELAAGRDPRSLRQKVPDAGASSSNTAPDSGALK